MKKQLSIVLTFLFVLPLLTMAQPSKLSKDFTYEVGTPYDVVDGGSKAYFSVGDNSHAITVKTQGDRQVVIQKFSVEDGSEVSKKVYEDLPKYAKVQKVTQLNNRIYYFYEAYNKKEKTFSFYVREVNVDEGSFLEEKKLFTTTRPVVNNGKVSLTNANLFSLNFGAKFEIFNSFDESKILIRYRYKPLKRRDKVNFDELGFVVLDNDLNTLWASDLTMPYTEAQMNNLAFSVSSNGNAFMLIQKRDTKTFEMLKINKDGINVQKIGLSADMAFQKFNLKEKDNGDIVCAGLYANGWDFKVSPFAGSSLVFNTNGVYVFEMDQEGNVKKEYKHDFPIALIKEYLNQRQQKKADKRENKKDNAGIADLKMVNFEIQDDGSMILLTEQQYVRSELWGTSTQNVYHYWHVVMMKIAADGSLVWMKKLPKNQAGVTGKGQMSVKYVKGNNGEHYVLYVGNPKNENLGKNEVPAAHKNGMGGYLTAYKVDDSSGDWEKYSILDFNNIDGKKKMKAYQFRVDRIFQVAEKSFFLEIYIKGKKDIMLLLNLND